MEENTKRKQLKKTIKGFALNVSKPHLSLIPTKRVIIVNRSSIILIYMQNKSLRFTSTLWAIQDSHVFSLFNVYWSGRSAIRTNSFSSSMYFNVKSCTSKSSLIYIKKKITRKGINIQSEGVRRSLERFLPSKLSEFHQYTTSNHLLGISDLPKSKWNLSQIAW